MCYKEPRNPADFGVLFIKEVYVMRIAVIGAAGKSGRLIASEAKSRGFDVTAIVKPGSADRLTLKLWPVVYSPPGTE